MFNQKALFCIVTGLFWFSLYAYVPQISSFAEDMGASYKMIGMITGAYGLSQTILRIPLGIVSDVLNKRKIFVVSGLFTAIFSALIVFMFPNTYILLTGRFLAGVAAATWVNFTVMFSGYYKPSESTKAIGIINSANMLGQFAAVLLGGILSLYLGVKYIFLLSTIVGLMGFFLSFFIQKEEDTVDRKPFKVSDLFIILKNIDILHICFLGILSQLITFATIFGFTPIVASNLGANNFELGLLTTLFNLPQILFSALAGIVFVKCLGSKNTLLIGFGLSTVLCIFTPFVPNLYLLYLIQIISGIGKAMTFPMLMGLVIKNVEPGLRTTTMGFYQAIYGIGMIMGPILLGVIGDKFGLMAGFIITGLLGILAIISISVVGIKD
ncbi:MAG: MFS transporter [Epulopiscium sp.]|nr:MFS transporter [Candidatus Epulonipiscium sp.]